MSSEFAFAGNCFSQQSVHIHKELLFTDVRCTCAPNHAQYSALTAPLDEALPGLNTGAPLPAGLDRKPTAKVSTLPNGLKVASLETYGPVATVGLVVGV